eukprot:4458285-Alexandrium_andersonii.AAC.1
MDRRIAGRRRPRASGDSANANKHRRWQHRVRPWLLLHSREGATSDKLSAYSEPRGLPLAL